MAFIGGMDARAFLLQRIRQAVSALYAAGLQSRVEMRRGEYVLSEMWKGIEAGNKIL